MVLADVDGAACRGRAEELIPRFGRRARGHGLDVTEPDSHRRRCATTLLARTGRIDVLVNSAAIDDKVTGDRATIRTPPRFENYPLAVWQRALDVNLTGTFLSCQILGTEMARRGAGSIINIASTYGMVAPDQRLYQRPDGIAGVLEVGGLPGGQGRRCWRSPASWPPTGPSAGVRVNTLSPGRGGAQRQDAALRRAATARSTPLGRMARPREMRGRDRCSWPATPPAT